MSRSQIIGGGILLLTLAAFGAVYQFYFREKLEKYKRDELFKQTLEQKFNDLRNDFSGVKPEVITSAWRSQIQPWRDAVGQRSDFFNFGGWFEHERPPEDGPMVRFWYDEESNKMIWDLYQLGNYQRFPADIREMFGVETISELQGRNVTREFVNSQLAVLSFGISAAELMLNANVRQVNRIVIWPTEKPSNANNLLNRVRIGFDFMMYAEDLVEFIEELRTSERYFSVDALKMYYPNIAWDARPELNVKMVLSQTNFLEQNYGEGAVAGGGGGGGGGAAPSGGRTSYEEILRRAREQRLSGSGFSSGEQSEPGWLSENWRMIKRLFGF